MRKKQKSTLKQRPMKTKKQIIKDHLSFHKTIESMEAFKNTVFKTSNSYVYQEFGKVKAKFAGSSAGHNGIESIDKFIGKDYSRVRIGIGRPKTKADVSDHVLKDFDEDEMLQLEKITDNIINSISILLDKKLDLFSSTVNNK